MAPWMRIEGSRYGTLSLVTRCIAVTACLIMAGSSAWSDDQRTKTGPANEQAKLIEQKLNLLERLISGRAATRIEEAGSPEATTHFDVASNALAESRTAMTSGNLELAGQRADESLKSLSAATRIASHELPDPESKRARYAQLSDALFSFREALSSAHASNATAAARFDPRELDSLTEQAQNHSNAGRYERGNELLTRAYELTVTALSQAQSEETVIYSLDLSKPADAYQHQRQKCLSYRTLVQHLMAKGVGSKATRSLVNRYRGESKTFYIEGEKNAQEQRYEDATQWMEQATAALTRVLSLLGLPVVE